MVVFLCMVLSTSIWIELKTFITAYIHILVSLALNLNVRIINLVYKQLKHNTLHENKNHCLRQILRSFFHLEGAIGIDRKIMGTICSHFPPRWRDLIFPPAKIPNYFIPTFSLPGYCCLSEYSHIRGFVNTNLHWVEDIWGLVRKTRAKRRYCQFFLSEKRLGCTAKKPADAKKDANLLLHWCTKSHFMEY